MTPQILRHIGSSDGFMEKPMFSALQCSCFQWCLRISLHALKHHINVYSLSLRHTHRTGKAESKINPLAVHSFFSDEAAIVLQ